MSLYQILYVSLWVPVYVCMSKKGEIIVRFHCGTISLEQIELLQLSLRVVPVVV